MIVIYKNVGRNCFRHLIKLYSYIQCLDKFILCINLFYQHDWFFYICYTCITIRIYRIRLIYFRNITLSYAFLSNDTSRYCNTRMNVKMEDVMLSLLMHFDFNVSTCTKSFSKGMLLNVLTKVNIMIMTLKLV